jgi:hypothetical protein
VVKDCDPPARLRRIRYAWTGLGRAFLSRSEDSSARAQKAARPSRPTAARFRRPLGHGQTTLHNGSRHDDARSVTGTAVARARNRGIPPIGSLVPRLLRCRHVDLSEDPLEEKCGSSWLSVAASGIGISVRQLEGVSSKASGVFWTFNAFHRSRTDTSGDEGVRRTRSASVRSPEWVCCSLQ